MDYVCYYIEAHIACAFLLSIILFKINKSVNKQLSQIYLATLVFILILYFFAEIFWGAVDSGLIKSTRPLLYLSNIFTYVLISMASYQWYLLSEAMQNDKAVENDPIKIILSIPVWMSTLLCVTAYRTGLVFYVDKNNTLVNGKLYLFLIIVPFGYLVAASARAFYRALAKDKYAERNLYFMIGVFPVAPILLGLLQTIYWRVPLLCYGAVAAVFYIYVSIQDNMISLDPLTQINNRNQMYKYLCQKMKETEPGLSLFILMVDVDKLRNINEAYGRMEGDRALVRISDAIKNACQGSRSRFFVSRYGGDEFVIVAEMAYRAEATWLADQIKNCVRRISADNNLQYSLSVSVGIAQYDYEAPVSLQAFISRAGLDLSKKKRINAG